MKHASLFIIVLFLLSACGNKQAELTLEIGNNTDISRSFETVSIPLSKLENSGIDINKTIIAIDKVSNTVFATQLYKETENGSPVALLFQPEIGANAVHQFSVRNVAEGETAPETEINCFSRFVPERIDDYAWENDKVAFRMYGPEAQRLVEEGLPGGTLSSGIDCWLKRVDYPVINKWYKKSQTGGSYHEDDGEGLDNYHVGPSSGCGGTLVYDQESKTIFTSKNYSKWEKIQDGNLRGSFKLFYEPWKAGDKTISEIKHLSIDKGSNLTRHEVTITGTENISAALTLHEKAGEISLDQEAVWFNYKEPHFGTVLHTSIVVDPKYVTGYTEHLVDTKDKSHLIVHLKPIDGKVVYYAGFYWDKSGHFNSDEEWFTYLNNFAGQVKSPLEVKIK